MNAFRRLKKLVRRLPGRWTPRGRYRFLVRDWAAVPDIELAARVLAAEGFTDQLEPDRLPVEQLSRVVVVAPHQDDETIGAGGLLLKSRDAGASLTALFVTDGVQLSLARQIGGEDGAATLAAEREAEARQVCEVLGADMHALGISNPKPAPSLSDLEEMAGVIRDARPDVLLIPWILDAQVKHRMTNHLLWLANRYRLLPDCEVWGYQVHNSLYPNGYVDITDVIEEKRKLLGLFRSQNLHMRRYDHFALGMGAWNSRYLPEDGGMEFALPARGCRR
jgi:LmbE family N-acetylglucosaminyl deacetylase